MPIFRCETHFLTPKGHDVDLFYMYGFYNEHLIIEQKYYGPIRLEHI